MAIITSPALVTLARGSWTETQLHAAFDDVQAAGSHWKDAQAGEVVGCEAANLLADAFEFFHAAPAVITYLRHQGGSPRFLVSTPGYAAW